MEVALVEDWLPRVLTLGHLSPRFRHLRALERGRAQEAQVQNTDLCPRFRPTRDTRLIRLSPLRQALDQDLHRDRMGHLAQPIPRIRTAISDILRRTALLVTHQGVLPHAYRSIGRQNLPITQPARIQATHTHQQIRHLTQVFGVHLVLLAELDQSLGHLDGRFLDCHIAVCPLLVDQAQVHVRALVQPVAPVVLLAAAAWVSI